MRLTTFVQRSVTLIATVAVVGACGTEPDSGAREADIPDAVASAPAGSVRDALTCLDAAEISSLAGLDVRVLEAGTRSYGDAMVCAYETTNTSIGGFVTTVVGPEAGAAEIFAEMNKSVKALLGPDAVPETIQLGERGLVYGGASKSEAAAVSQGRVYSAEITSTTAFDIGDKSSAMTDIVRKLMAATETSS